MTTLTLRAKATHHKTKALHIPSLPWKLFLCLGVIAMIPMLVFYVYFINQLIGGSYVIKNYNKQMDALLTQNVDLQTNFAKSGFLGNMQSQVANLNFQKTTDIKYIQLVGNSLGMVK